MIEGRHAAHRRPLWLAALIAWVGVPLGYTLFVMVRELARDHPPFPAAPGQLFGILLIFAMPFSTVALFLGLPLAYLFRARGWLGVLPVVLSATVVGTLAMLGYLWILQMSPWPISLEILLMGVGFGAAGGVVFCLAAGIPWRSVRL